MLLKNRVSFFKSAFTFARVGCLCCLFLAISFPGLGQKSLREEDNWVRSTIDQMTLDQKIGQLFMVRAYSSISDEDNRLLTEFITQYHIGGICFFQGSPEGQVDMINRFQQLSKIPLFMGIDGEWGLGMRFPGETISFPKQLMLGAITDNHLIYEMGREVARHCRRTGINVNFAPSLDIFNNPQNKVIFDRSFGESKENVTSKGYMYMKGMEDEGVLPCIKHFPGHGDTEIDSHLDLPVLTHNRQRLEEVEFYPFIRVIGQGAGAMMVGHLQVPSLDNRNHRPASLSDTIIQKIIRTDLNFKGLLFTDAMDMKGVTKYFPSGIAEAEAFLAGNDVILLPQNLIKAITTIKTDITRGRISIKRVNESVERILRTKFRLGLTETPYHPADGLQEFLLRNQAKALKQKLTEEAITLVADTANILPLRDIHQRRFATFSLNVFQQSRFQERIDSYVDARHYQAMPGQILADYQQYLQTLSQFDHVLVAIHTSGRKNDFSKDLPPATIKFIGALQKKTNVTVILFGQPLMLAKLKECTSLILAYDNAPTTQDVTAQTIFGANGFKGTLPVTVDSLWQTGHGITKPTLHRLGYSLPEMTGISSDTLQLIDSLMSRMILQNASPGAQLLIAKEGKIIFEKNYGHLYPNGPKVTSNTMYDLASLTKVLGTTLAAMKLTDQQKMHVHHPLRYYISGIDSTDKAGLLVRDVLAHVAGLSPGIAFHKKTMLPQDKGPNPAYYSPHLDSLHTIPVAKNLFVRTDFRDTMFHKIIHSPLRDPGKYLYSDLGFLLLQRAIEGQSGRKLNEFLTTEIYKPLGLNLTSFLPLQSTPEEWIAPTEMDHSFRKQLIQGHVHDTGAALMGGVAGHAGLFSNARGVAVLMQMLLNKGAYGGQTIFHPEIVAQFTHRHPLSSRRGLGFDMKEQNQARNQHISTFASEATYGHTGFTGCAAWADPEHNLILVFQTNRTMFGSNNHTFNNQNYRVKVHDIIYRAMEAHKKQE
jgi:beta-N-acetylhexosaminidase